MDLNRLEGLKKGITIDGTRYKSIDITPEKAESEGANTWLRVAIREGKNREVRRVV